METFFVSQSLTNVLFLHLNSSTPSKHVFIAVGDFRARKKNIWNQIIAVQFSTPHPGKGQISQTEKAFPSNSPPPVHRK